MLIVEHLSKSYQGVGEALQVLRDVSFTLNAGQSAAIVGPSGSGKSTLLQILGTLDQPDSGTLTIDGINPFSLSQGERAQFRNQQIGFVFQEHHLLPQLSVLENVLIPAIAIGTASPDAIDNAHDLIKAVGLASREQHRPGELSGGERERVAIARALLMRPNLILADEPTGNLDSRTAQAITDLLLELHSDRDLVLIAVTHSHTLAESMQTQYTLQDGVLVHND